MNITTKLIIIYLILFAIGMSCNEEPKDEKKDKCNLALIYISSCALDTKGYTISVGDWNSICNKKVAEEILELSCDKIVSEYIK